MHTSHQSEILHSLIFFNSVLQTATLALDFRVTTLEENVNKTFTELEVWVETLEGTAADHETRISAAESYGSAVLFNEVLLNEGDGYVLHSEMALPNVVA